MDYIFPKHTGHKMSAQTWHKILLVRGIKNGKVPKESKPVHTTSRKEIIAKAKQVVEQYRKEMAGKCVLGLLNE